MPDALARALAQAGGERPCAEPPSMRIAVPETATLAHADAERPC